MTSVTSFGQDRDAYNEQATAVVAEMQSVFGLSEEFTPQLTQLLEQVMHKADYVQNSGKIEGDEQEKALMEIKTHYKKSAVKYVDEDKWEEFMQYSMENLEFMQ